MIGTCFIIVFVHLLCVTGASESGIVGGKESKPHSRRYMASLQFDETHHCGGILIREDFVLSAAHCFQHAKKMSVVLGAHNISMTEASQQRIDVAKYFPHPCFDGNDNDIMLLKLKKKANLNSKYVGLLGLPKKNLKVPALVDCLVVGWGKTAVDKRASNILKEATEKLQFNFECKNRWQQYYNSQHMLCTTFDSKTGGICQGDSGGPLICQSKLLGLAAYTFRNDCSNSKYPHVFMNVHHYLPWIQATMKDSGNVALLCD